MTEKTSNVATINEVYTDLKRKTIVIHYQIGEKKHVERMRLGDQKASREFKEKYKRLAEAELAKQKG